MLCFCDIVERSSAENYTEHSAVNTLEFIKQAQNESNFLVKFFIQHQLQGAAENFNIFYKSIKTALFVRKREICLME